MTRHYLKLAFRHIWKHKMQNILSILGIAVGLICFSISTYYIRQMENSYTAHPNYRQMAQLSKTDGKSSYRNNQIAGNELKTISNNRVAGIKKIAWKVAFDSNFTFVKGDGKEVPFKMDFANINPEFTDVFSFRPTRSKTLKVKNGDVLISASCARKVFGEENPVGKSLYFSRASTNTSPIGYSVITDVIHDLPNQSQTDYDIYFVYDEIPERRSLDVTILLTDETSVKDINQRLKKQFPELNAEYKEYPVIQPFKDMNSDKELLLGQSIVTLVASLILIAALINFLKFNISSFYNRTRELCLRKSLGSNSSGLFNILFTEISILLIITVFVTYSLTEILLPVFFSFLPESFRDSDKVKIDTPLLLKQQAEYLSGVLVICSAIIWIAIRRINFLSIIKGIYAGRGRKHGIRNFMLGVQIFICLFFIGAASCMFKAYHDIESKRYYTLSSGECKRIWSVVLSEIQLKGHEEEIVGRIKSIAGVEDILFYFTGNSSNYTTPEENKIRGVLNTVSTNYYTFMNLPVQGKPALDENSIVITRSLANQMEKDNVEGPVTLDGKSYQVTGIIEQLPFEQLGISKRYHEYSALSGSNKLVSPQFYVKCTTGKEMVIKQEIMEIIRSYLPATIPFVLESLDDENNDKYGGIVLIGKLFTALSVISLIITVLGIYSAISLDTQSRQKEVAIRKINGAEPTVIARLFGRLYIRLFLIASAFAVPVLVLLQRSLELPVPGVYNPLFWLGNLLIVAGIIFVTVAYRIRLISKLNPADIIKSE